MAIYVAVAGNSWLLNMAPNPLTLLRVEAPTTHQFSLSFYFLHSPSVILSGCQNMFEGKLFIREMDGNQRDWPVCL